ncbi:MAG: GNAT family N-acetyltransferase [Chthoniobacterales bacterium]
MSDQSILDDRSPETALEWERYFDLRWRVLREPWDQPRGSEKDELDSESFQVALWEGEVPVAAGRLHFNDPTEAQVRYMAVEPQRRGYHLGSRILGLLETRAAMEGAKRIVLNAREEAAGFYRRHGYEISGPAGLLFGSIPHVRMEKHVG